LKLFWWRAPLTLPHDTFYSSRSTVALVGNPEMYTGRLTLSLRRPLSWPSCSSKSQKWQNVIECCISLSCCILFTPTVLLVTYCALYFSYVLLVPKCIYMLIAFGFVCALVPAPRIHNNFSSCNNNKIQEKALKNDS